MPRPPPVTTAALPSRMPILASAGPRPPPAPISRRSVLKIPPRVKRPARGAGPPGALADALRDAVRVLVDAAEEALADPGALQVVVRRDLPGVAHAAVDLDAGARG